MDEYYEIAIVGAGPAGLAAAVQAASRGVSHILLERAELGNTIVRYGKGKHVMAEPAHVSLHQDLLIEFEAASREEVLEKWESGIERGGVTMVRGSQYELLGIEGEKGDFTLRLKDGSFLKAGAVVIAIGTSGSARQFGVPGDDLPHVKYFIEDHSIYVDKKCVVVGAGDAGIEEALQLLRHDNDITLINMFEGFPLAKTRNRMAVQSAIAAGQVREFTFTTVERFEDGGVWLNTREKPFFELPPPSPTPGTDFFVEADLVVGRIGALAPRRFLESLGVAFDGPGREAMPKVSETLESSRPGIYLVGALAGKPLIKHCMNHGYEVVEHILGQPVASADLPILREILSPLGDDVEKIVEHVRTQIQLFKSLNRTQTEELLRESKIHRARSTTVLYEYGDFSNTFFTILEGAVEILPGNDDTEFDEDGQLAKEPIRLQEGDFFGVDGLMSGRPRRMTAVAVADCVLIETSPAAISRLMKSVPEIRSTLNQSYASRKLQELFPQLPIREIREIAADSVFESYQPGAVLFEEEDEPDGLHVIRRGSVVVTRERGGRERVINHIRAGEYIGEIALVRPTMARSATVKAMVLTETMRIPPKVLLALTERHPQIRDEFESRWKQHLARDERILEADSSEVVDFVIAKGGKEATDLLVIDENLCIRCDNCEKACSETHMGVSRLDREAGPRFAGVHLPTCEHCENPFCMTDCPPDALRRHPNGEVYILDTCIGCGNCAGYCPYDVIKMQKVAPVKPANLLWSLLFGGKPRKPQQPKGEVHEVAVKCDLCRDVPGVREGDRTVACVASCPTGAIVRLNPVTFVDDILENQRMS